MSSSETPTFEVLPDETSLSFSQYRQLSPEERRRRDELHRQQLSDPQHVEFLTGLLKLSLGMTNGSRGGY